MDESDRLRADALRNSALNSDSKGCGASNAKEEDMDKAKEFGDVSPMDASEEIIPLPNPSS